MKLSTARFWDRVPEGAVKVSVARSQPQDLDLPVIEAGKPSYALLDDWYHHLRDQGELGTTHYTERFMHRFRPDLCAEQLRAVAAELKTDHLVLCCWCSGFCHRHLIIDLLKGAGQDFELGPLQ